MREKMKGFKFPPQMPLEKTEICTVHCNRCHNTWPETVTHYGIFAGYARNYDCCEKCITPEDKARLGIVEMPEFKGAICRGCYALGNACGQCEKCEWERSLK